MFKLKSELILTLIVTYRRWNQLEFTITFPGDSLIVFRTLQSYPIELDSLMFVFKVKFIRFSVNKVNTELKDDAGQNPV